MKRVFFDVETSPNVAYVWKTGFKLSVGTHAIVNERAVICICWKVEGERRVHSLTWDKDHNDRSMLVDFIAAISDADELVAHNGLQFDVPWLRGRCLKHGLVFPDIPCLDTCKQARRQFNLNSNALDYIAQYLNVGQKIDTDFSLWTRCMNGSRAALAEMVRYCKHDVTVLESVFTKLRPYLRSTSHAAGVNRLACPVCGSHKTGVHRHRVTAAGLGRVQLRCRDCGKFFVLPETVYKRLSA